jgi:ABC-type transport system substrate-binding protein
VWSDGVPVTAQDLAYWYQLYTQGITVGEKTRQQGTNAGTYGDVQTVETLDGNRVRITLGTRDPLFLEKIAYYRGGQVEHPYHLTAPEIESGNVDVTPVELGYVSSGPFVMKEYEKGVAIEVVRYDQYWEKDDAGRQFPYLDGVEYLITAEPAAMHAAFRTGRLDATARGRGFYIPPEMLPSYRDSLGDTFWLTERVGGDSPSMGFNTLIPPFNDVRVRQAISLWIDRPSAIDAMGSGFGELRGLLTVKGFWNPDLLTWPGYNAATKEADRAEAKRLLAEAGYADGLTFTMLGKTSAPVQLEWFQGALAGLGVDIKLELFGSASYEQKRSEGNWQASDSGIAEFLPEGAYSRLAPIDIAPRTNVIHNDPKMADFFNRLGTLDTLEDRRALTQEMERYILRDQAYMVLTFLGVDLFAFRDYVNGVPIDPVGAFQKMTSFSRVWLDQ